MTETERWRPSTPLRVVVDIETLYEFEQAVLAKHAELYPKKSVNVQNEFAKGTHPHFIYNFCSRKTRENLISIYEVDGFFQSLEPTKGALLAMQGMLSCEIDVKVCISSTVGNIKAISEQMKWLEHHLGPSFMDRVIVCKDKTLIQSDFLIDSFPTPAEKTEKLWPTQAERLGKASNATSNPSPSWIHVLYPRPYNKGVLLREEGKEKEKETETEEGVHIHESRKGSVRVVGMKGWRAWKDALGVLEVGLGSKYPAVYSMYLDPERRPQDGSVAVFPFFRHGSEDSLDEDRLYLFPPPMPSNHTCEMFRTGRGDDRNVFTMTTDGTNVVNNCFFGYPDEVNNALLATYHKHPQDYPLPIAQRVPRVVALKVICALSSVVTKVLKVKELREEIVGSTEALKEHDLMRQEEVLRKIDFVALKDKYEVDEYKFFAFQFGQALALIEGKDLYTKRDIAEFYPDLEPFIYRKAGQIFLEENLKKLNARKDEFIREIEDVNIERHGGLYFLTLKPEKLFDASKNAGRWNHFHHQSRGMVVDVRTGQLVCYPYHHAFPGHLPEWPADRQPTMKEEDPDWEMVSVFKYNGKVCFTGEKAFTSPAAEQAEKEWTSEGADFDRFIYILQYAQGKLIRTHKRHRFTLEIL